MHEAILKTSNKNPETLISSDKQRKHDVDEETVCKVIDLQNIGFYWEAEPYVRHNGPTSTSFDNYIIQPTNIKTQIKYTSTKASTPKITTDVYSSETKMNLTSSQLRSITETTDNLGRRWKRRPYREFHPRCRVKGHVREWWVFCITCVLYFHVREKRKVWTWQYMREYRRLCRKYKEMYRFV